ncbi:MAG TPA: tetratricopeptide repeat protein, partial [Terriglobales bacterium]
MVRPVVVCCLGLLILLGKAFPQEPAQFESLLASAQQAQAGGDFQAAAEFYRQAVAIQPQLAELRANLGLMYYQTGNDDLAIKAFREAIRLKPDLLVPNLFLGLDYLRLKRFDEAIPYLKRAAVTKPTDIQAQIGLAQAYSASRKPRLAITSYLHVTQLDPGNADVWYYLGTSYLQQVEADASLMLARHKDSAYLQALTAEALFDQGAFGRSADFYEKTLAFGTLPPETHANYGFTLLYQHDNRGAEREMNAELAANPGSLTAKLGLARLHLERGEAEQSAQEIESIAKADRGFLNVNAALFNAGLPESKRTELQQAFEKLSADKGISEKLSVLFRNPTDGSTPETSANRAVTNSQRRNAPPNVAAELYARGRYADCSDLLISRIPLLPAKGLELLASCAYSTGDYHNAQQAAARLASNPATETEGLYWEIKSSQKLASNALAHASQMDSSSPKLHVLLGDLYREKNSNQESAKEYRK